MSTSMRKEINVDRLRDTNVTREDSQRQKILSKTKKKSIASKRKHSNECVYSKDYFMSIQHFFFHCSDCRFIAGVLVFACPRSRDIRTDGRPDSGTKKFCSFQSIG